MKAVTFITLVTLADLMLVTLAKLVDLKVGNRIIGLYKAVTVVTLEIRNRKL